MKPHPNTRFLREGVLPHYFCPGCGCGQILNYLLYAMRELNLDMDKVVLLCGVGCSSRIPVYVNANVIHGTHGRTLAMATGIKLVNPDLPIIIFTGDGDLASIGTNHFVHAARRNLDVTVICVNNGLFGMTGGQAAPTTPLGARTSTSPMGNLEGPFDLCKLAECAGATHVSRWTTVHPRSVIGSIKNGVKHKGFSFIEIVSPCPTYFGRYVLKISKPVEYLMWLRKNSITKEKASSLDNKQLSGKIIVGEFVKKHAPTLIERYQEMEREVKSSSGA